MSTNDASPEARPPRRGISWGRIAVIALGVVLIGYGGLVAVWNRFLKTTTPGVTRQVIADLRPSERVEATPGACRDWNVLIVTFDTTRADHIGAYGHRGVKTPVLDELARGGVLCANAATTVPATLPAHSSLMTGLYPFNHGVRANGTFRLEDRVHTLAEILREQGYRTAGAISAYVLDETFGIGQGFETFFDDLTRGMKYAPNMFRERAAELTNEDVLPWLRENGRSKFFAWVHYFDPHATYLPPEPYRTEYATDPYSGEIAYADSQLGRILDLLTELGVRDRTLVVMTSDHGEGLGEHNEQTHSLLIYDSTMHIPLILNAPGALPAGLRLDRQVSLIDVAPTLLDLLGVPAPAPMDGVSLIRDLPPAPRSLYIETLSSKTLHGWAPLMGVRREDYKYIFAPRAEVYDLRADPRELNNLYKERPDLAVDLHEELKRFVGDDPLVAADVQQNLAMDAESIEKLAALGYVTTHFEQDGDDKPLTELIDPKDGVLHWETVHSAVLKRDTGDVAGAIQILEECVRKVPGDVFARQVLASSYQTYGRHDDALEMLRAAEQISPGDITLPLGQAGVLTHLRRLEESLEAIERARRIDPDHPSVQMQLANVCSARHEYAKAIEHLQKALELDRGSNDSSIRRNLGEVYMQLGQRDEALAVYQKGLETDAFNGELHAGIAEVYVAMGDDAKAAEHVQQGLRFNPVQARALAVLAGVHIRANRLDEAIRIAERALAIAPKFAAAAANLGLAWRLKGDEAKAEQIYRDAIDAQPRYDVLHQNLAQLLLRQGRVDDAVECFRSALRCNPYNTVALANLAVKAMQDNDLTTARRYLRRAIRIDPKYALAHKHLGALLLKLNRPAQAIFHLQRSLELDSQQPEAGLIRFQIESHATHSGQSQPAASDLDEPIEGEDADVTTQPEGDTP